MNHIQDLRNNLMECALFSPCRHINEISEASFPAIVPHNEVINLAYSKFHAGLVSMCLPKCSSQGERAVSTLEMAESRL